MTDDKYAGSMGNLDVYQDIRDTSCIMSLALQLSQDNCQSSIEGLARISGVCVLQMIDVLEQDRDGEGDISMDDGNEEDDEMIGSNSADPSAKAEAIQKANQKKLQIQREKKLQKRVLQQSSDKTSDSPEEAPAKRTKQARPYMLASIY